MSEPAGRELLSATLNEDARFFYPPNDEYWSAGATVGDRLYEPEVDFAVEPPGSWLLSHVPWTEAEHRITAFNAGGKELVALGISAGAACMALERWTWRGEERITYARQVYPGDRYALVARFRP